MLYFTQNKRIFETKIIVLTAHSKVRNKQADFFCNIHFLSRFYCLSVYSPAGSGALLESFKHTWSFLCLHVTFLASNLSCYVLLLPLALLLQDITCCSCFPVKHKWKCSVKIYPLSQCLSLACFGQKSCPLI